MNKLAMAVIAGLVVVLICFTVPGDASSTTGEGDESVTQNGTDVAPSDLQNQITAAEDSKSAEFKLSDDGTLSSTLNIPANKIIVLDLNGKTMTINVDAAVIQNSGTLTVKNGTIVAKENGKGNSSRVGIINSGILFIEQGTHIEGYYAIVNNENLTINDGEIETKYHTGIWSQEKNAVLTINGGTFKASYGAGSERASTIRSYGTINIYGGTFESTGSCGAGDGYVDTIRIYGGGTLTIQPGEGKTVSVASDSDYAVLVMGGAKAFIKGGTFECKGYRDDIVTMSAGTAEISGGTFKHEPDLASIASGYYYEKDASSWYVISKAQDATDINVTDYSGLVSAVGSPLSQPKNINISRDITIPSDAVLKLEQGFTITIENGCTLDVEGVLILDGTMRNDGVLSVGDNGFIVNILRVSSSGEFRGFSNILDGVATISTPMQLQWLAYQVEYNGAPDSVVLANDISIPKKNGLYFTPIGTDTNPSTIDFNGNGHTISGLNVFKTAGKGGLFGVVKDSHIQNFTISGATIGTTSGYIGAVAGSVIGSSAFQCIEVTDSNVTSTMSFGVGGLIGKISNGSGTQSVEIIGCTVEDSTIGGFANIGALWGTSTEYPGTIGIYNVGVEESTISAHNSSIGLLTGFQHTAEVTIIGLTDTENTVKLKGASVVSPTLLDNPSSGNTTDTSNTGKIAIRSGGSWVSAGTEDVVCMMNGIGYRSLDNAVSDAQKDDTGNSATITLLEDVTISSALSFTEAGEYILDIGDHTVTHTDGGYMITVGGSSPPAYPLDTINTSAKLTIIGSGTINAQKGTVFRSYGTMVFGENGSGPTVNYGSSDSTHSIFKVDEGSFLTVNGGTFNLGTAESGNVVTRVMQTYGTTVINNGTFNGDIELWFDYETNEHYTSTVTINGGTVSSMLIRESSDGSADNTIVSNPSGTYSRTAVASIQKNGKTVCYASLSAAVSGASDNATITVFGNTDCVEKSKQDQKSLTITVQSGALLNHGVMIDSAVSSTCTRTGLTEGSHCSRCGLTITAQQTTPMKAHSWVTVPSQDATCTSGGHSSYEECSACNAVRGYSTIPATGHSWDSGTITTEATETSEGVKTYKCSNCSATKTESIPKLTCTHTWDSGTVTQEATCGAAGSKTLTCSKCGETKTESIAATGNHSWDSGTVVKEPTTTESGTTEYKCTVCGQTKTATIEPKKTEVEEKDGVKTTTDTTKVVEKADDGSETTTETTTVSKEENGKVVEKVETTKSTTEKDGTTTVSESTVTEKDGQTEKVETTKSTTQTEDTITVAESTLTEKNGQLVEKIETTTSTTQTEDSIIVSETKVTEKAGKETEKVETVTSTTQKEGATIVAETKVTEKGQEKTETIAVSIGSDDGSVKTDVSVSDGTTSGIETVISGDVTDDTIAHAIKQADMATEAISDKVSDVSKNISVSRDNVTLSPTSLSALADSGASLTITGDAGSVGIDADVTGTMMSRNEDVTISISEKKDGLTEEQKQKAGENKVIELSAKSATEDIHELGGTARVRIDMTGMDFRSPAVYWLKDDGTSERVDAEFGEGYAAIELNHFSLYYIAETAQESENSTVVYVAIAVVIIAILAIAGVVMYKRKTA